MDRVAAILGFQWRAYWRRFHRAGNLTTNNAGVWILFGGIGVVRYLQLLPRMSSQLAHGETARYEALLIGVFLIWMFPVMGESWRSITSRALLHTPLTPRELFLIRLGSVFVSPVTWVIVACSLALGYPLANAPNPLAGMIALVLFLLFSLAMSLTIAHVLSSAAMRKLLLGAIVVLSVLVGAFWLTKSTLALAWWPNRLTADAAVVANAFRPVAALAVLTIAAFGVSLWTFKSSLQYVGSRRSQRFTVLGLIHFPGRLGGLLKKDLRYFVRLLDVHFALPIVILFVIYLASNPEPSVSVFRVVLIILFLPWISMASNCFGLDSPLGLDRYSLFPLSGRDILLSKNLAFALLFMILVGAVFPLAFWRFGAGIMVLGFVELVLMELAYLSWGNWVSVRDPYKMQFYRFSAGGSPADAIMGMLFGSVPGLIMVYSGTLWTTVLLILVYSALYYLSLTRSGRRLDQRREVIRQRLS
jgi:hypothetical protein